jgi:hypothetical protein
MKDRVTSEVQKVKATGGTRAARIREIVREATAQVVAEFKEGKGEIETLSKEALATVIQDLDKTDSAAISSPVELPIPSIDPVLQPTETMIQSTEFSVPDHVVLNDSVDEKVDEVSAQSADLPSFKTLMFRAFLVVKQRLLDQFQQKSATWKSQVKTGLQDEYADLKNRAIRLDETLNDRYGDRYAAAKQNFGKVATWYQTAQAQQSNVQGTTVLEQQQTIFASKAAEVGTTVAQKEQQLRQQLKSFLTTTAAKL